MTVIVRIGRRIPKKWYSRIGSKVKGLLTYQENMWQTIAMSFKKAKSAAKKDGRLLFKIETDFEPEDLHYQIEWMTIKIKGSKELEQEEYEEALQMYDKLSNHMKKDFDTDENISKRLKTSKISNEKIKHAYEKGYGAVKNKNISNKLLEMGIMTDVEKIDDYDIRDDEYLYK